MTTNTRWNHRQIIQLAFPMIISNLSTPLLGLVDTAVMGHLDTPQFLGGVALGGLIFSFIYWGFGFLRMGTTGLTAQAFGNRDHNEIKSILGRALLISTVISILILASQFPVRIISFWLIESSAPLERLASRYYDIRIWSAPATLSLYVLLGWFLGLQDVKSPLYIVLVTNLCNIFLDILLVVYLKMDVNGVAFASVLAEYSGMLFAVFLLQRKIKTFHSSWSWSRVIDPEKLKNLLIINNNIFIRTLCLIFAFAFFTAQGAKFGETILAANAILLNFLMLMAFALDGFAHAAEALVGRALGASDKTLLNRTVLTAALWSCFVAFNFSVAYAVFGMHLINILTSLDDVRNATYQYLPWVIFMPMASFACYLLDGIFIGATLTREMRNTMLFSILLCFLPTWYFFQYLHNHGLWLTLTVFMLARSVSMSWVFKQKKSTLINKLL